MKTFKMVYVVHFHDLTQKASELLETDVKTANDLLDLLETKYPGIAKLIRENDGTANPRNGMILNREGIRAKVLSDFSVELQDGDRITLL